MNTLEFNLLYVKLVPDFELSIFLTLIIIEKNVQNKNKAHFLKNVLYDSNSVVSMV
jgi:hypothetical protein